MTFGPERSLVAVRSSMTNYQLLTYKDDDDREQNLAGKPLHPSLCREHLLGPHLEGKLFGLAAADSLRR